jgi:hypothetical protein
LVFVVAVVGVVVGVVVDDDITLTGFEVKRARFEIGFLVTVDNVVFDFDE